MDISAIRHRNLLTLVEELGGIPELAAALGVSYNDVHQIVTRVRLPSGKPRGVGNDRARKLEQVCGKPVGWMDHDHGDSGVPARVQWIMREVAKLDPARQAQLLAIIAAATGFAVPDEDVARKMLDAAADSAADRSAGYASHKDDADSQ